MHKTTEYSHKPGHPGEKVQNLLLRFENRRPVRDIDSRKSPGAIGHHTLETVSHRNSGIGIVTQTEKSRAAA